jgi:hypothetical protein
LQKDAKRQELTFLNIPHQAASGLLPRGELFIARDFLDHFYPEPQGAYIRQLSSAARALGLSVIGTDLDEEWSHPLLTGGEYAELEGYFLVGCINGPVSHLIKHLGFFKAMVCIKNDHRLFADITGGLLKEIAHRCVLARANGFAAFAVADDIAGKNGLLFSYDDFVSTALPFYTHFTEIVKANDLSAFFHSDGDTRRIIELLIDAGYDCIHPVDGQAGMDLHQLQQTFGGRISFMGHVDIMAWGPERVSREVAQADTEYREGSLILGSSCGISLKTVTAGMAALYPRWNVPTHSETGHAGGDR